MAAQAASRQAPSAAQLKQLAAGQQWNQIVLLLERVPRPSAEMDYELGTALAQLGRLTGAQRAFAAGRRLAPADPRFPIELAGIAFKQKNYPRTIHRLRQALRLTPKDAYANNFIATVYFLEGNIDASLKYWNRVGKPRIEAVREDPEPRISPALLDQTFTFSPASTLRLPQLLATDARVRALGVFPQFHFDLDALDDGNFDVVFRARELNGFGDTRLESTFLFFQGLPFQEVNPQFYNLHGHAINFVSMLRWDAQKRRIFAQASGPFEVGASHRWELVTDNREESWAVRNGFTGYAPVLASFKMRHEMVDFHLLAWPSARLDWSVGAEISHRNFRDALPTPTAETVVTPPMLASGYQLKQQAQLSGTIWRVPEHRFSVTASGASDAGRLWSQPRESFEKLTGSLGWHWFPQAQGDDYETSQLFRAGKTFGQVPWDELFILGLERDNDLPMHAHIGTRDGRKGSAPLGHNYFLQNWEMDKNIWGNGIVGLQLGPLFDIGKITDPGTKLGSHEWLFDTGVQAKLRVFGSGLVFSYGKDLRTGNNAFYVEMLE